MRLNPLQYVLVLLSLIIHSDINSQSVFWTFDHQFILDFTTGEPDLILEEKLPESAAECRMGLSDDSGNVILYVDSQ